MPVPLIMLLLPPSGQDGSVQRRNRLKLDGGTQRVRHANLIYEMAFCHKDMAGFPRGYYAAKNCRDYVWDPGAD